MNCIRNLSLGSILNNCVNNHDWTAQNNVNNNNPTPPLPPPEYSPHLSACVFLQEFRSSCPGLLQHCAELTNLLVARRECGQSLLLQVLCLDLPVTALQARGAATERKASGMLDAKQIQAVNTIKRSTQTDPAWCSTEMVQAVYALAFDFMLYCLLPYKPYNIKSRASAYTAKWSAYASHVLPIIFIARHEPNPSFKTFLFILWITEHFLLQNKQKQANHLTWASLVSASHSPVGPLSPLSVLPSSSPSLLLSFVPSPRSW